MISIVVACDPNNVIGKDGKLPWHIPEDLKVFKSLTMGHVIVMGRKTWESLPKKPLPGRTNVVISRTMTGENCYDSLDKVLEDYPDVYVIGGAEIYRLALPKADQIFMSKVKKPYDGDTYFPELIGWKEKEITEYNDFNLIHYVR